MSTIVTRAGKGSPLTNTEVDSNFTNLNTDKVETLASADGSIVITGTGASRDLSVSQNSPASVLLEQVRNSTGATLTKGTAVYISGATGQIPTVSKALATGDATSAQTLGLLTSNLANNANGYATIIGLVSDIDTSAYTDGAQLYLSPTTAGTLTATKPYAPQHLVYVAVVAHAHPTQGKLLVKVQNGYEMDELHNVSAQSPTNGQTLVYNTTTSLWEKNTVSLTAGVNGTLPVANGGTGQTTRQNAMNALAGALTSGSYLRGNGTDVVMSAIQAADVPTLNQNTTGTAANVTGTVAIANGGTGATTATAALTALGAYPALNPSGYTSNTGTVTGVTGTAPVVSSGGTAPAISMAAASAGVNGYMTGAYATKLDGIATGATANTGTVTGVTGTAPVVSSGGTAPAISMAAASSGIDGYMTGAYATKLDGIATGATANTGTVTGVTGTAPVVSSGGTAPAISMAAASSGVNGYMTGAYATKLDGIATGATNVTNNNQLTNGAGYITSAGNAATATASTTQGKTDASTNIATTAFSKWMFATPSTTGTLNWNDSSNTIPGVGTTLLLGTATNGPGGSNYYHPFNIEYSGISGTGNVTQMAIAYGYPGNELYMRGSYGGTFGSWVRFLNSNNYNSYVPTLTGTGASGTWGINVTGYSRQLNLPDQNTVYTILDGPANGPVIKVRYDGGTVNRYIDIGYKDGNGTYYEGLKIVNGDTLTMNGSTVLRASNYNSYAPTLTGTGASGSWGISISGNAATATTATTANALNTSNNYSVNQLLNNTWYNYNDNDRNASSATYYPNASARAVRFFFAGAGSTGTGGNYAGVMQFNPWDGTTASTGDASYQLAFGSTAANSGGVPQLNIRKGIDTTWNSWYTLLHSGNVSSYALPIAGGSLTTGATNNLFIGRNSTATSYNSISLNGNSADASNMGLTGGGGGDTTLYINAPGNIVLRTSGLTYSNTISSYAQFSGSTRSPIFYDSDNTAFYADLAGTTNINTLSGNGKTIFTTTDSYLRLNEGSTFSSGTWFGGTLVRSGGVYVGSDGGTGTSRVLITGSYSGVNAISIDGGSGIITAAGDVRAPIFYDANDTAYYVDPNGVSRINNLLVSVGAVSNDTGGLRNVMPTGGSYVTQSSSVAGAIVITLPVTVYPMIKFRVSVYTYDGLSFDIYCGGHNSSGYWYNTFAYMGTQNRAPLNVRFTYGSGLMYVYIGEIGQSWSYPQVFVTDVQVGYTNYEYNNWDNGWTISFNSSTYNNISSTHVVNPPPQSSNNSSAVYAPVFYDYSNTAYYADPASTSNFVGLTVANTISGSISGNAATASTASNLISASGVIQSTAVGSSYSSAIQVREVQGYGGTSSMSYAPRLGFHWSGVVASSITMETSGRIAITNNPGTAYENLVCYAFTAASTIAGTNIDYNPYTTYAYCATPTAKNGYYGMLFGNSTSHSQTMYDGSGNGGEYNQSFGWISYFYKGNSSLGIMSSSTSASYALYVTGSIYATANVTAYSDRRAKKDIETIDNALDKTKQLRGVYYRAIEEQVKDESHHGKRLMGVIAQEVLEVVPEVVTYDKENDKYGVSYANMVGLLIEAVKELSDKVTEQDVRIARLETLVSKLIGD